MAVPEAPTGGAGASTTADTSNARWRGLYGLGGVAANLIAMLLVGEIAVYAALPRPGTALEHVPASGALVGLAIGLYFAAIVFLFVWVILVGRRLRQLDGFPDSAGRGGGCR